MKDNHSLFIDFFNLQILIEKQSVYFNKHRPYPISSLHIGKRSDPGYPGYEVVGCSSNSTFEQRFYLFVMRKAQAAILETYRKASITMSGMRPISELLYLGRYYKNVGKSW